MSELFTVLRLGPVELCNRIMVSPMSQYSAMNGEPGEWHGVHYGALANSGAGLVVIESTHISERSRGTPACLGLYTDAQERKLADIIATCKRIGHSKIGIQLNHSGRKASSTLPWAPVRGALAPSDGGWQTESASALSFGGDYPTPHEPSLDELETIKTEYVASAKRALRADADVLEIHAAHGYFLHSFLSPLANQRGDKYGGSAENHMRFPLEVFDAVRAVWPKDRVIGVKVSSTDWDDKGAGIENAVAFVKELERRGCDYVVMTSGATTAGTKVPVSHGYQTVFAEAAKKAANIPVFAVGLIYSPEYAEGVIATGQADGVAVARGFLDNPHWAWHAANVLDADVPRPNPYLRASAKFWPGAKAAS